MRFETLKTLGDVKGSPNTYSQGIWKARDRSGKLSGRNRTKSPLLHASAILISPPKQPAFSWLTGAPKRAKDTGLSENEGTPEFISRRLG